jgi:hypothetical protein
MPKLWVCIEGFADDLGFVRPGTTALGRTPESLAGEGLVLALLEPY